MRGLCDFQLADQDETLLRAIMPHAYQTEGGTRQTYCLSRYLLKAGIPGDFVECGVAAGAQLACMALAIQREGIHRTVHGFDSFEGIPFAGPNDTQQPGFIDGFKMDRDAPLSERLKSSGISGCPVEQVRQSIDRWGFTGIVKLYKGWFQDTLPKNELSAISFLRLDGDLYESTESCLRWLYDKVSPGGIVYVDDYSLEGCAKAVHEFLIDRGSEPEFLNDVGGNRGAIYWIKQ